MAEHSKEPWLAAIRELDEDRGDWGLYIRNPDDVVVAIAVTHHMPNGPETEEDVQANAKRIVACVNACAGIPTEALANAKESSSLLREARGCFETLLGQGPFPTDYDLGRSMREWIERLITDIKSHCDEESPHG